MTTGPERSTAEREDDVEHHSIGSIATEAGVTVAAVRYYHELGLVEPATRVGGKRRFTADTIGRISFIRRAQQAGFSLDEIKLILGDDDRAWLGLVQAKIAELEQRRAELGAMVEILKTISACGCQVVADCPRFESC